VAESLETEVILSGVPSKPLAAPEQSFENTSAQQIQVMIGALTSLD
jgi:hypothetical protein